MELDCPECNEIIVININYAMIMIGDEFTCPKCNAILELNYDETWNGKEGNQYFWFETIC